MASSSLMCQTVCVGVANKPSGQCCTLSIHAGMELDQMTVLFCVKDDVIIVSVSSVMQTEAKIALVNPW